MSTTMLQSRIDYKYLSNKSKDWLCRFVLELLDFADHCREPKRNPREDGIIEGFLCWHPDEKTMKEMMEYHSGAFKIFSAFDQALVSLFEIVPEQIIGRRPMINWLDQEGWKIKSVNLLYKV